MGRPKKFPTVLMKVPTVFKNKVKVLSKKYGHKHMTDFLYKDGSRVLSNADAINDLLGIYFKRKR